MTNDDFTTAARAYARERYPSGTDLDRDRRMVVDEFAVWARDHLAEQEPTDGEQAVRRLHHPVEVEPSDTICAACSTLRGSGKSLRYFPTDEWPCATIQALDAARASRREEAKR